MSLRQEQVVLLGTLAVLGVLGWSSFKAPATVRGGKSKSGGDTSFERHTAPDTKIALPAPRKIDEIDRDVFSKPSDTRPLPPLPLADPPIGPLWGLRPLTSFDVAPRYFASLLRSDVAHKSVTKLFKSVDEAESSTDDVDSLGAANDSLASDLKAAASPKVELSAEERAQLAESWKKLYDWMRLGDAPPIFGQIRNPDRYGLKQRSNEAVLFVQVKPETGAEVFPGQAPVGFPRERVTEFGFADTPSNHIQLKKREFTPPIGASRYSDLLGFASECVSLRLQAREALQVAEEMFTLAAQSDPDDPTPQFGLGQCYEAGFQFEKAYELYSKLVEKYPHKPETYVMLGQLEARFRMFDSAEQRMHQAETSGGRGSWIVQQAYGRFLNGRQRYDEALPHLEEAFKYEPSEPAMALFRARIRTELGAAQLALGKTEDAKASFEKALQATPGEPRAEAGKFAASYVANTPAQGGGGAVDTAGFDLLMARAMLAMGAENFTGALDLLKLAAEADPLRAGRAWAAMSWLAEITGYPEDALRCIEKSVEADPSDAWAHYQHGRVLVDRGDVDGARAAFVTALDIDLDFTDALLALAELSRRTSQHSDAERYFSRVQANAQTAPNAKDAPSKSDSKADTARRAEILARRGVNMLDLGEVAQARDVFEEALKLDGMHPLARVGQAWCTYRAGDSQKAIQQFAELKDVRRSLGETDAFSVYAEGEIKRIQEHESKKLWSDRFERRRLMNGWDTEESVGPTVTLDEGAVHIAGNFNSGGRTRLYRSYAGPDFVSVEMDITVKSTNNSKVALFLSKERRINAAQNAVQGAIAIGRRRDGGLIVLAMDTATADENWEDVAEVGGKPWWPADKPVRVRIELIGDGSDRTARLSVDGIAVREGIRAQRISASTNDVRVGAFAESQTGLPADVVIDNVEVVFKTRK